jgi:hypothetical protein
MTSSSPSPDKFQREIDDIIRLAEKRLERQAPRSRPRTAHRAFKPHLPGISISFPSPEVLAGWGLVLLLVAWLLGIVGRFGFLGMVGLACQVLGIALLALGIALSLIRGRTGASSGGRVWRGERISYGNPYGDSALARRIKRFLTGRSY